MVRENKTESKTDPQKNNFSLGNKEERKLKWTKSQSS